MQNEFKKKFFTVASDVGSMRLTLYRHGKWLYHEGSEVKMYPNPFKNAMPIDGRVFEEIFGETGPIGDQKQYEVWIREVDHSA
jgi:hypothetical protein